MSDEKSKYSSIFFSYSIVFALTACIVFLPFIINGKHLMWNVDGLQYSYPYLLFFGDWLRGTFASSFSDGHLVVTEFSPYFGLGGDIIASNSYLFGNPFNYLFAIVPKEYSEFAYDFIVVGQMLLAGVSFSYYCYEKGESINAVVVGAILYAFSPWMLNCTRQESFILPLILFPLLILGSEKLAENKSPALFIISASLFLLNSFYFSYIAFIFLAIYCIYLFMLNMQKSIRAFLFWVLKVALMLLVALMISSILLLPIMGELLGQDRLSLERCIPLFYSLKHYVYVLTSSLSYAVLPADSSVGISCITFLCILVLYTSKNIVHRQLFLKVSVVILMLFLCVPYICSILNGFQYPSFRWSFVYVFLLSYLTTHLLPFINKVNNLTIALSFIMGIIVMTVAIIAPNENSIASISGVALLFLLIAIIILTNNKDKYQYYRILKSNHLYMYILLISVFSIGINFHVYMNTNNRINQQVDFYQAWAVHTEDSPSAAIKLVKDETLWRYDVINEWYIPNNNLIQSLKSYDMYNVIYNQNYNKFRKDLEISDSQIAQTSHGLTGRSYLETALGTKYYVLRDATDITNNETKNDVDVSLPFGSSNSPIASLNIKGVKRYSVYKNELYLPISYTFDAHISQNYYDNLTSIQKQQAILQAVAVDDDNQNNTMNDTLEFNDESLNYNVIDTVHAEIDNNGFICKESNGSIHLEVELENPGELYLEFTGLYFQKQMPEFNLDSNKNLFIYLYELYNWEPANTYSINVSMPGKDSQILSGKNAHDYMYAGDDDNIINLGYINSGKHEIAITFNDPGFYGYSDFKVLLQPTESLSNYVFDRNKYPVFCNIKRDNLYASLTCDRYQYVFFSLPYSSNWTAQVDGEEYEILKADNAFMAIYVAPGSHQIHLKYHNSLFDIGLCISLAGIILALIIVFLHRHKMNDFYTRWRRS